MPCPLRIRVADPPPCGEPASRSGHRPEVENSQHTSRRGRKIQPPDTRTLQICPGQNGPNNAPELGALIGGNYNNCSSRAGTPPRVLLRAFVSSPPPSARSGRPPPRPLTCLASVCITLPAWTLAV